ncbi:MAG: hypothetical protein K2I96_20765 [Lachnospiraceae bacterium]|nr:hypothetical protein [Lachnospiraceae bacterium]
MRKIVHSRLLCVLLMVSMLVLGIYCEDIHNDSSFSRVFDEPYAASLQAADHIADTHIYLGKGSLSLIEDFVPARQSARTSIALRISQCMIFALLIIGAYLLSLSFRNSNLCMDGYGNLYNRRTLEYIHHNDGKKSHIS